MKRKTEYCSGYVWEKGRRKHNQDALLIRQINKKHNKIIMGVVCDGIAGLSKGELVSTYTVYRLLKKMDAIVMQWENCYYLGSLKKIVNKLLYETNQSLLKYAKQQNIKLGTTMSMVIIYKDQYWLFHIGDGRIYHIRKKGVKQLSRDEIKRQGKGALSHALGVGKWKIPYCKKGKIRKNQGLLICSDGFYRKNEDCISKMGIQMEKIKEDDKLNIFLKTMTRHTMQMGETDNCSAILIKRI